MTSTGDPRPCLGETSTHTVRLFTRDAPLALASGRTLGPIDVAYETYGKLNADASNAVVICHALTGDAHAAGWHPGDKRPGWWDSMIGPGKPIDTDRFFVISSNLIGGCQGSTGPSSIDPATGRPYGLSFPLLAIRDFVEQHRALATHLGVRRPLAVVGGSMGGMQALEWALAYPDEVANAAVIASTSRLTAQNIAFSAVARRAIMDDPRFHGGDYAAHGQTPVTGLGIARMMAHITYMSEDAFTEKFGRTPHADAPHPGFGIDFAVESYLDHQAETFVERFDALSYLYLTRVMDYFDPFTAHQLAPRERPVNFLVLSFDTDWRFGPDHGRRIVRHLEGARYPVTFRTIASPWGHDAFLLPNDAYHATVAAWLDRALEDVR